jgi:BolA protein
MTMAQTIHQKLTTAFTPQELTVDDESARHAGHSGARPGGETHFNVRIVTEAFSASRVSSASAAFMPRWRRSCAAASTRFR